MNTEQMNLKQRWEDYKTENPRQRIRNAAEALQTSEASLLATGINDTVIRLNPTCKDILSEIQTLGKVMALTRNDDCVHERKGVYLNPDFSNPHAGLFVNPDIDLRIFLGQWTKAFAVVEPLANGQDRKSIQFFSKHGDAIHKIYLTPDSNVKAFDVLVDKFKSDNQEQGESFETKENPKQKVEENQIDLVAFHKEWESLKDTHDFFMLLKKYKLSRTKALELAPSDFYAKKIEKEAIVTMLEQSVLTQTPIMVFTGNKGLIQIHTGEISNTMWHHNWFNIMDPDFNMHLDMEKIDSVWVVRKPTVDGTVTSLEVYDKYGEQIVQFFGARKPGVPELEAWREIVDTL